MHLLAYVEVVGPRLTKTFLFAVNCVAGVSWPGSKV